MEQLKKYLKERFRLTAEDADIITSYFTEEKISKNHFFVSEGKTELSSAILLEGVVRYFAYDDEGNDPTCYFSFEYHILMDPFTYRQQKPATLNIASVTPCRLAVLSYEDEEKLITAYAKWPVIANEMLLEVSMEFANQKTMTAMAAGERYDFWVKNYPGIANRVPLQYVATYLGITQQSLSRLRKNYANK